MFPGDLLSFYMHENRGKPGIRSHLYKTSYHRGTKKGPPPRRVEGVTERAAMNGNRKLEPI